MKAYRSKHNNHVSQLQNAETMIEKMRSAVIMQAWIDGFELVCEIQDELVFEKKG